MDISRLLHKEFNQKVHLLLINVFFQDFAKIMFVSVFKLLQIIYKLALINDKRLIGADFRKSIIKYFGQAMKL